MSEMYKKPKKIEITMNFNINGEEKFKQKVFFNLRCREDIYIHEYLALALLKEELEKQVMGISEDEIREIIINHELTKHDKRKKKKSVAYKLADLKKMIENPSIKYKLAQKAKRLRRRKNDTLRGM